MSTPDPARPSTTSTATAERSGAADSASIGEVIDLVKDYARQETIGPLKGAGRWLALGAAGALLLATGAFFIVLGVLRLFQHEMAPTFRGYWMRLLPYLFALVTAVIVIALAVSRIGKKSLNSSRK